MFCSKNYAGEAEIPQLFADAANWLNKVIFMNLPTPFGISFEIHNLPVLK